MTIEHYTTTAAVSPATDIGFQDVHDGKRIELGKREIRIVLVALEPIELVSSGPVCPTATRSPAQIPIFNQLAIARRRAAERFVLLPLRILPLEEEVCGGSLQQTSLENGLEDVGAVTTCTKGAMTAVDVDDKTTEMNKGVS
jgi:hypothetical protein